MPEGARGKGGRRDELLRKALWYGECTCIGMNLRSFGPAALPIFLLPALTGCFEQVPSQEVTTASMFQNVELVSRDGLSTEVGVELTVGGPLGTSVELQNGDELRVSALGETVTLMKQDELFGGPRYVGALPHASEGAAFSVDYLRGDASAQAHGCGRTNAVGTFALMAKPFEIAPIMVNARLGQPVTIAWSNRENGAMQIAVSGSCIVGGRAIVGDSGAFVVDAAMLSSNRAKEPTACSVKAVVSRCRAGQVSAEFGEGGQVKACQERTIAFRITP